MKQPAIQITERQQGPNAWATALIAGGISAVGIILAVAIWQISIGLSVAVGAVGIGIGIERICYGIERICYGLSMLVYNARRGQAEIERARLGQVEYPELEAESWTSRPLTRR